MVVIVILKMINYCYMMINVIQLMEQNMHMEDINVIMKVNGIKKNVNLIIVI